MKQFVTLLLALVMILPTYGQKSKAFEITKNLEVFSDLYRELNTYYVDDIDPNLMMSIAIKAMMKRLDPYTVYYSENQIESYRLAVDGSYDGIGVRTKTIDGRVVVMQAHEGGPAQLAGLQAGDEIVEIDNQSTENKTQDEIKMILRGVDGSKINIGVKRYGKEDILRFDVERGEVNIKNVPFHGWASPDIGYVVLTTFTRNASANIKEAILALREENPDMKGLILDLRDNGGGLLTEAINVSNLFVPKNEIVVTTRGKIKQWNRTYKTQKEPVLPDLPLAVLINGSSASASEIVSGVIQDLDRGILVGSKSFGKGLVQSTKDISYRNRVKLTTARYHIPSGRCIQSLQYDRNDQPIALPDSLRNAFKTKSGRMVLDGGGVEPELKLNPNENIEILKDLIQKNLIFKYATIYHATHPEIEAVENFKFGDYKQFEQFLVDNDFHFQSNVEKDILALDKKISKEIDISSEIKSIKEKLLAKKQNALQTNKAEILKAIEQEIISRYYLQSGKFKHALKNDIEVRKAVEILTNKSEYHKWLTPKS